MSTMENQTEEISQVQDIVFSLATSPNFALDGLCFAARQSGLYRSRDSGRTWRSAYDQFNLGTLPTTAVIVSPAFETDKSVFAGVAGSVLRSLDGGQTWQVVMLGSPPPQISTLVLSPGFIDDEVLWAGTLEDGVFCSQDRGYRWAAWNFGLLDLNILCMAASPNFSNDETLFVGTGSGIFRSTNGGRAWREIDLDPELAPVLSVAVSPDHTKDGVLFAGTESCGLMRSSDRGNTWQRVGAEAITEPVNAIILSPEFHAKPDVLVLLSDAILISHDGGQSWSRLHSSLWSEYGATCVAAPDGLSPDATLLVGFMGGHIARINER